MRILAIETASEACSLALFEAGEVIARDHRILGRGHAEALVPMIAALPNKGRSDQILVSLGPGSFTGVRIGLATARALGLAWGAQVLGYPTLALVAAMAQARRGQRAVSVSMPGGPGEWFVPSFAPDGAALGDVESLRPEDAVLRHATDIVAGTSAQDFAERASGGIEALDILPDAAFCLSLNPSIFTQALSPIYGRAPDATPQKALANGPA